MRVRVKIARMAVTEQPMSRRERNALSGQISSELARLLDPGLTYRDTVARRRPTPSLAGDIASAIAAQLPGRGRRA